MNIIRSTLEVTESPENRAQAASDLNKPDPAPSKAIQAYVRSHAALAWIKNKSDFDNQQAVVDKLWNALSSTEQLLIPREISR